MLEQQLAGLFWDDKPGQTRSTVKDAGRLFLRVLITIIVISSNHDIRCKVPLNTIFNHDGLGVVIASEVKLGDYCVIGQNVTIGLSKRKAPVIGWGVVICPHSIIIGDVRIGHHSIIGAGSVVLHNVPPYSVVVGIPGHIIRTMKNDKEYWLYRRERI